MKSNKLESVQRNENLLDGFKHILRDRSAVFSTIGYILMLASMSAVSYCPSYIRQTFPVSTEFVSTVFSVVNILYSIGSIVCARVVKWFGRKPVLVSALFVESVLILLSSIVPNLWLTLFILYLAYMMMGFVYTVAISLALEQVPGFQGTMMSLNTAAGNLGMGVGSAAGGAILLFSGFGLVGLTLGTLGILATLIYLTQVKDPSKALTD